MKVFNSFFILAIILFLSGCADITPPTPEYLLKRPLGTDLVKLGMTKDQVRGLWGEPNQINQTEDKSSWGGKREEWVYIARYSLPLNAGYLTKTKKLYFDGENLTNIVEAEE